MSSFLFLLTSIAFFLASIRLVLFWTFIWQKNNYYFGYVTSELKNSYKAHIFLNSIFFLIILFFYLFVIFNDRFEFIYQVLISTVFITFAFVFVKEIFQSNFMKPFFTLRALLVCTLAIFLTSFLFSIPLIDSYVWLIILYLFIPLEIVILLIFFAFPAEIYEDFITGKALRKIELMGNFTSVLIIGKFLVLHKKYLSKTLQTRVKKITRIQGKGYFDLINIFNKSADLNEGILFISLTIKDDREIKKIINLFKPTYMVVNAFEENIYLPKYSKIITTGKNLKFYKIGRKRKVK